MGFLWKRKRVIIKIRVTKHALKVFMERFGSFCPPKDPKICLINLVSMAHLIGYDYDNKPIYAFGDWRFVVKYRYFFHPKEVHVLMKIITCWREVYQGVNRNKIKYRQFRAKEKRLWQEETKIYKMAVQN